MYVEDRQKPFNSDMESDISFGSMAADGKNFKLTADEARELREDIVTAPYVKRFVGAKELIHDLERWIIWMPASDPVAIRHSPILRSHIEAVRKWRSEPGRDAAVGRDAAAPYRYHRRNQPDTPFLCIPRHFAESRDFTTVAYFTPDVVPGDATFVTPDPTGLLFAIIETTMFMTWQKTVGGRIRNDPRFGSDQTWNNFPLPDLAECDRAELIVGGKLVLEARSNYPGRSLDQLYTPLAMPEDLIDAHRQLDRVMARIFGVSSDAREIDRQRRLFRLYQEWVAAERLV